MASFRGNVNTQVKIGNQFASITNFYVDTPMQSLHTFDSPFVIQTRGQTEVTFSGIVKYTPEVLAAVRRWMYDVPSFPHYEREFLCLYCGSPQSITRTHCAQCGAPRSFLVG